MEFETKEVNGSIVYVRKNKKEVKQREDFPGDKEPHSDMFNIEKFLSEIHSCTHNCGTCKSHCGNS